MERYLVIFAAGAVMSIAWMAFLVIVHLWLAHGRTRKQTAVEKDLSGLARSLVAAAHLVWIAVQAILRYRS
jgi:hypothetical protein